MPRPRLGAMPMTAAERMARSRQRQEARTIELEAENARLKDENNLLKAGVLTAPPPPNLKTQQQAVKPSGEISMRPLKEADIARFRGYSDEETDPIFQPGELVMVVGLHTRDPDVLHCIRAVDRARYEANDPSLCGDEIRRSELDLLPYDPLPADDPTRWYVIDNVKTINDQRDLIGRLWSGLELIAGGYANAAEAQAIARHVMKPIAGSGGGPQTSEVPVKRVFKIKPRPKSGQKQRMD